MGPHTRRTDNTEGVLRSLDNMTNQFADRVGFMIERRTKENVVIMDFHDTGATLNSVNYAPSDKIVSVGTEYAAAGHEGYETASGSFVPGKPFLRKAVIEVAAELPKEVDARIEWEGGR